MYITLTFDLCLWNFCRWVFQKHFYKLNSCKLSLLCWLWHFNCIWYTCRRSPYLISKRSIKNRKFFCKSSGIPYRTPTESTGVIAFPSSLHPLAWAAVTVSDKWIKQPFQQISETQFLTTSMKHLQSSLVQKSPTFQMLHVLLPCPNWVSSFSIRFLPILHWTLFFLILQLTFFHFLLYCSHSYVHFILPLIYLLFHLLQSRCHVCL